MPDAQKNICKAPKIHIWLLADAPSVIACITHGLLLEVLGDRNIGHATRREARPGPDHHHDRDENEDEEQQEAARLARPGGSSLFCRSSSKSIAFSLDC